MAGTWSGSLLQLSTYLPFFLGHCIFLLVHMSMLNEYHRLAQMIESSLPTTLKTYTIPVSNNATMQATAPHDSMDFE